MCCLRVQVYRGRRWGKVRVCVSELACVGLSYFFGQFFFFFKNRDSFLCFKNNQIDDCAVLNVFYFFMVTILLSNSTQTEQKRCDYDSGFVGKRIDRRVGTRKVSTSVIQITLKRLSVYIPVQSLFSETGLLVTFL